MNDWQNIVSEAADTMFDALKTVAEAADIKNRVLNMVASTTDSVFSHQNMQSEVDVSDFDMRNMESEVSAINFGDRKTESAADDSVSDIAGVQSGVLERALRTARACRGPHLAGLPGMVAEQSLRATGFRCAAGRENRKAAPPSGAQRKRRQAT
jgi:hypothetical protein